MITDIFPDPDLLPLEIEQTWVDDIASNLPERLRKENSVY